MPTFVARFRRNLPTDFYEWVLTIGVLALGMLWLVFPNSFNRADMVDFLAIMPPRLWTTSAIMVGLIGCVGIAAITEAPRLAGCTRIVANMARIVFFGAFLGRSFASSDFELFSAALGIVLWTMFIVMDMRHISKNVADTFNAFRKVRRVRPVALVR